jgi:hypothetical protein
MESVQQKDPPATCPICAAEGHCPSSAGEIYRRCTMCGHEVRSSEPVELFIVNDLLDPTEVNRRGALDRFKSELALKVAITRETLIDVGSASGKFLHLNKAHFRRSIGVEVTPACIEFSRGQLNLEIAPSIPGNAAPLSLVTFWHTLEHIEIGEITRILASIRDQSSSETRLIISVPNGDSLLYRILGRHFAYYDPESHRHTFTRTSLEMLLTQQGFVVERQDAGLVYELFGAIQTALNCLNPTHNFLYYRRKRGRDFGTGASSQRRREVIDVLLAGATLPLTFAAGLFGYLSKRHAAVINLAFRPA